MAEHSISGPNESVRTKTGGLPILPDTILSQHMPCFEHAVKPLPVMSDASHFPNIFPVLATIYNTLWLSYDQEIPTLMNGKFDHLGL